MTPRQRAHRILERRDRYHDLSNPSTWPDWARAVDLRDGEGLLGYYENDPGSLNELLLISDQGLRLRDGDMWRFLAYDDIDHTKFPLPKDTADHLEIATRSGSTFRIPVRGGQGRYRDAFSVLHFIDRAVGDVRREQARMS